MRSQSALIPPLCATSATWCLGSSANALAQTITIDGAGSGRTYDGIGAVSGGGGTSPLLRDFAAMAVLPRSWHRPRVSH
jgi:hypothetical protein